VRVSASGDVLYPGPQPQVNRVTARKEGWTGVGVAFAADAEKVLVLLEVVPSRGTEAHS